jgi:hypothetical protein
LRQTSSSMASVLIVQADRNKTRDWGSLAVFLPVFEVQETGCFLM